MSISGGTVGSAKPGSRYRIGEGDMQDPALVAMRCVTDEWSQFHLMRIDSPDWIYCEKKN